MRRIFLASPYAGDTDTNTAYLRACLADAFERGEAPFAPHAIYTQPGVLRDEVQAERELGMCAGIAWLFVADALVLCVDLGVSSGMEREILAAQALGIPIERRWLGWAPRHVAIEVIAGIEPLEATGIAVEIEVVP